MNKDKKININSLTNEMVNDNLISENDRKVTKFLLEMFEKGHIKFKDSKDKEIKEWYKNLKDSGYFKGNKILIDKDFEKDGVPFLLMILVAKGLIKRK